MRVTPQKQLVDYNKKTYNTLRAEELINMTLVYLENKIIKIVILYISKLCIYINHERPNLEWSRTCPVSDQTRTIWRWHKPPNQENTFLYQLLTNKGRCDQSHSFSCFLLDRETTSCRRRLSRRWWGKHLYFKFSIEQKILRVKH